MINKQILNYKITREIGSGGMATVYEAVHVKLDTKVAIKVLNPVLAANDGIRKRFEQEAKIMASLNHEGITKVIDFDEKENNLAIVMEYLNGQTLDEYIIQKGALGEKEAKEIFIPILKAFSYAHGKSIVHRDVKPSNIFITTQGKVKIMDFGIAKIIEDGANVLTQTGTQMGTPVYMSPEQVNDSKNIDHRTDIYSLGVMLYFMLSGKPPYDATKNSSFQIFTKIVNESVPNLTKYPEMDRIIQKATEKDAINRIDNCMEFIIALQKEVDISEDTQIIIKDTNNISQELNKKEASKSYSSENIENTQIETPKNYTDHINGVPLDMIFVEGSSFQMGSNENNNEQPIHKVTVNNFYVGKYPVTQKLWKIVMSVNPSYFQTGRVLEKGNLIRSSVILNEDTSIYPVENVSWNDAIGFIKRLNEKTGKNYRLCSESEWEYAAKGGSKSHGYEYTGSDDINEVAWYNENSHNKDEKQSFYRASPVGRKHNNELGIYDMSGNVCEWVQDKWHDNYNGAPIDCHPWLNNGNSKRIHRGGGYCTPSDMCRITNRKAYKTDKRNIVIGLRLAHSLSC
jgi:serine/threonine protein kinase